MDIYSQNIASQSQFIGTNYSVGIIPITYGLPNNSPMFANAPSQDNVSALGTNTTGSTASATIGSLAVTNLAAIQGTIGSWIINQGQIKSTNGNMVWDALYNRLVFYVNGVAKIVMQA